MSSIDMDKIDADNKELKLVRMKANWALEDLIRARNQHPNMPAVGFVLEVGILVGRIIAADNVHNRIYGRVEGAKSSKEIIDNIINGLNGNV